MTKTLTEQWREGTLEDGWYYLDYDTQEVKVEIKDGRMYIDGIIVNRHSYGDDIDLMVIKGSVPSYQEFQRLQEQLKEANELLRTAGYGSKENIYPFPYVCPEECRNYLEKWGVK